MDQNINSPQLKSEMTYNIQTFGCKVNTYDTGLIYKNLSSYKWAQKIPDSVHILNTCAVTAEATQQAVREIRRIKAKNPFATIVVTGCAAQVDTGLFEKLPSVDLIVANSHKGLLPELIEKFFKKELSEKTFKSNIFKKDDRETDGGLEPHHSRSFLKIQDGCNSFCTFCIIPYARGKSRSIPIAQLVGRINEIEATGVHEVVLTGVHIGDYEDDSKTDQNKIEDLVEAILSRTKIRRLRLSSLEPIELSDRLLSLFSNTRMCPHFHMSIQSADSEVLTQMKRHYDEKTVIDCLKKIKSVQPQAFIGIDVIAGFPTETEAQFENTYKNLASSPWTRLHVFPYSERQGTRAATLNQIPHHIRKERAKLLRELSLHRFQSEALKQKDCVLNALILKKVSRGTFAISDNYWPITLAESNLSDVTNQDLCSLFGGQEKSVRITGFSPDNGEGVLIGELV
jgi:threonylcarbamoyladenosine tRNA methylthiotransferase MtaB